MGVCMSGELDSNTGMSYIYAIKSVIEESF